MLSGEGAEKELVSPLRWHDEVALQRIGEQVQRGVTEWSDVWGVDRISVFCRNAWDDVELAKAPWRMLAGDESAFSNSSTIWMAHSDDVLRARMAKALYGLAVPADSIASKVTEDALHALFQAISAALGVSLAQPHAKLSSPPSRCWRAWSGAVLIECQWAGQRLVRLLSLPAVAPARPDGERRGDLAKLSDALRSQPVPVKVTLAETPARLAELLSLQIGDILVTSHALSEPLRVSASGGSKSPYFLAQLGQQDGQMAVTLTAS